MSAAMSIQSVAIRSSKTQAENLYDKTEVQNSNALACLLTSGNGGTTLPSEWG